MAATAPPTIWAPNTSAIPYPMTIACIDARYAKDTPIITGSFAPQNSSMNVIKAAATREDWINNTLWLWFIPATDARIIAGVTDPTIMANRC